VADFVPQVYKTRDDLLEALTLVINMEVTGFTIE
jgi:hypothetical protein